MSEGIYQNVPTGQARGGGKAPPLPGRAGSAAAPDVVYSEVQLPPRGGKDGRVNYSTPMLAKSAISNDVVYADLDLVTNGASASRGAISAARSPYGANPTIAKADDQVLYADMSHLAGPAAPAQPTLPTRVYKAAPGAVPAIGAKPPKLSATVAARQMQGLKIGEESEYVNMVSPAAAAAPGMEPNKDYVNTVPNLLPGQAFASWTNTPDKKSRRVILQHKHPDLIMLEDSNKNRTVWATNTLRGFGQKANLFAFEAGRRSSTGEGVYKFTMDGTVDMADSLKKNKK